MLLAGALLGLLLGLALALARPAAATVDDAAVVDTVTSDTASRDESFAESQRVTAIDLLVEVYPKLIEGVIDPAWYRVPGDLKPSDFEVTDGEIQPLIAVETAIEEPWRIVVHVDRHLSSTASIRRAASRLAAHADKLTELGSVEIVDSEADGLRQALAPTRDAELVNATLSQIALRSEADGRLLALRAEFLESRDDPELAVSAEELAALYAAEEHRRIERQHDDLLLRLLDVGEPRDRKALFLLSDGFDLEPEAFYTQALGPLERPAARGEHGLSASYEAFAHAVSAYGWAVVPVFDPLVYEYPDKIGPRRALLMKIDRNRNPERAEALLDLGRSQLAQGEWSKAERTLEQAIHRFYDHPKTRQRQATAELLLARALRAQERHEAAELAERRALALDPERAAEVEAATARLLAPEAPLALIAEAAVGVIVDSDAALDELLDRMHRRVRLTYQVAGAPDGALRPVSLTLDRLGYGVRAPAWVRSSTPEAVAAARVRRLLRADTPRPDNELRVHGEASGDGPGDGLVARAVLAERERTSTSGPLRVSVGVGGSEMLPRVAHAVVDADTTEHVERLAAPLEAEWLAVVVEDLGTGARRQAVVDLEANP